MIRPADHQPVYDMNYIVISHKNGNLAEAWVPPHHNVFHLDEFDEINTCFYNMCL